MKQCLPNDKSLHLPTCSYFSCYKQESWPSLTFIVFVWRLGWLALFDSRTHLNSKADACCHWRTSPGSSSKEITSKIYAFLGNRGLDRLFTTNSKMFRLHVLNQLLEIMISNHPSKWTEDELFKDGEWLAKGLVVVNEEWPSFRILSQELKRD